MSKFRHDEHRARRVDCITTGDRVAFQWKRVPHEPELEWTGVITWESFKDGVCVGYVVHVDAPQHGIDRATLHDGGRKRAAITLDPDQVRLVDRGERGRALESLP